MNTIKRIISWVLAVTMLLSILPMGVFAAETEDHCFRYGRSILERMSNTAALLYAYDVIEEASFGGTPASISLAHDTYKLTYDEAVTVYRMVRYDHPELFWHDANWNISVYSNGTVAAIKPKYLFTGSALATAKAALESEVERLTADLSGKSDYEKSLILHDRVVAEAEYVYNDHDQSAYGALVLGTAVCAGYTRAYQMLLQRVGITSWYVVGESIRPENNTSVSHGWNLVQLDGNWYYTDTTWDDRKSYTSYAYFNITTAQLLEDHVIEYAEYMPIATATANNYFVRNDLCRASFNVADVADIIRNYNPPRIYVTGNVEKFIQDYDNHVQDLCIELNVPGGTSFSYGYHRVGNAREIIPVLNIPHTCKYVATTVPATCNTSGYRVETCSYDFCHNERNRTVLPATGAHTYDNACDATCNVCGARRSVGAHVYDNACDTNCNICGAIRTVAPHSYTEKIITSATCGTAGLKKYTCRQCGASYTVTIPATGAHTYDNVCDADCNVCYATRWVEGHRYDTDCDDVCNHCGEYRPVPDHVYDHNCDADCNVCGALREIGPHVYDNECDTTCRECGAIREVVPHPYEETVLNPATCGLDGLSEYTCPLCGDTYNKTIPATGAHTYDNVCDADCNVCYAVREVEGHRYDTDCDDVCNNCGEYRPVPDHVYDHNCDADCNVCGALREIGPHVYDNECAPACRECGAIREVVPHPYEETVLTPATCGADGLCEYTCPLCGDTYNKTIPATGAHTYDTDCDTVCNGCDFVREVEPHPYVFEVATPSSCGGEGVGVNTCPVCGDTYTETIPATGEHVYDDACDVDCNDCGATRNAPHVYDNPYDADCNLCGVTRDVAELKVGDLNGDGRINIRDLGLLQQYLNHWDVFISLEAADTNGDGKLNIRDLGLLQQYLNHWDVELK